MKFVNDFGLAPNRGNVAAAGIDFFVPDARQWNKECRNAFIKYVSEKYTDVTDLVYENMSCDECNSVMMYFSHNFAAKNMYSFKDWLGTYWDANNYGIRLRPLQSVLIPSGIRIELDDNTAGIFLNKSGVGISGLIVKAQVIDKDYTGYVHYNLVNVSDGNIIIHPGQKIVQLLEVNVGYNAPYEISTHDYYLHMSGTIRGEGMAGSTGLFK